MRVLENGWRAMNAWRRVAWALLLAALVASAVVALSLLLWAGFGSGHVVGESALPPRDRSSDEASAPAFPRLETAGAIGKDDAMIEAVVQERLAAEREVTRSRFIGELVTRIEAAAGRDLSPDERDSVARSNRVYFSAIDHRDESEDAEERAERIGSAARMREEVLARIMGSKEVASRLLEEAMSALVREPAAAAGATDGHAAL